MRKQLSFKKVVESIDETHKFLLKNGFGRENTNNLLRIYIPLFLDFIFNKISNYPKDEEIILKQLRERMNLKDEECVHCGSPKKSIAGLARDMRGKIIRCPFHE